MAIKYCDPQLTTGNQDGTTKADAWRTMEQVIKNTPFAGTITAGDVIHVRSQAGGTDITETPSSSEQDMAEITDGKANPVILKIDNGVVWPGDAGQFTFITGSGKEFSMSTSWILDGTDSFRIVNTIGSSGTPRVVDGSGILINATVESYTNEQLSISPLAFGKLRFENVRFITHKATSTSIFASGDRSWLQIINCVIDYANVGVGNYSTSHTLLEPTDEHSFLEVKGLEVVNCESAFPLFKDIDTMTDSNNRSAIARIEDLKLPSLFTSDFYGKLSGDLPYSLSGLVNRVSIAGGKDLDDMCLLASNGWTMTEKGYSYPTLNSTLPDGTLYSLKVYPAVGAVSKAFPLECAELIKNYDQPAGVKTITLEMLYQSSLPLPLDSEVWMEIAYTSDSTGKKVTENTRVIDTTNEATLSTSTAPWSVLTYVDQAYTRYKIEFTTSESVKQFSDIKIRPFIGIPVEAVNQFWFYDPDVSIV